MGPSWLLFELFYMFVQYFAGYTLVFTKEKIVHSLGEYNPRPNEIISMFIRHLIITGLVWGCTTRTWISLIMTFILSLYITIFISFYLLSLIRHVSRLEKRIEELQQNEKE